MPISILFWVIYVLALIFGLGGTWPGGAEGRVGYFRFGGSLVVLILIGILGWRVFGPVIHD